MKLLPVLALALVLPAFAPAADAAHLACTSRDPGCPGQACWRWNGERYTECVPYPVVCVTDPCWPYPGWPPLP